VDGEDQGRCILAENPAADTEPEDISALSGDFSYWRVTSSAACPRSDDVAAVTGAGTTVLVNQHTEGALSSQRDPSAELSFLDALSVSMDGCLCYSRFIALAVRHSSPHRVVTVSSAVINIKR
jgi:hypothetical protein